MIAETGMSSVYNETLAATWQNMMPFGKLFHSITEAIADYSAAFMAQQHLQLWGHNRMQKS